MEEDSRTIYCSLDLEMSGFDPEADEILEIGFVFFTIDESGTHIIEEWTHVFRPTQPVHPKILGLTGISQTELEQAPLIAEHLEFLQTKLENAIIVGHSIKVDIAFLEKAGLTLKGGSIDTLELAQFILPTQHSYNLENLIHSFSIVSAESHRALADAKATMALLEKMLGVYQSFPKEVHEQIQNVVREQTMLWKELLSLKLPSVELIAKVQTLQPPIEVDDSIIKTFDPFSIVTLPIELMEPQVLAGALKKSGKKFMWVVSDKQTAISIWKNGLAQALLPAEDYFDNQKFEELLKRTDLSPEEVRFVLKILIWRATNWQTESLVDLNISFFGGQFRHLISATEVPVITKSPLYVADYETFLRSSFEDQEEYTVIFERMADLERSVSKSLVKKASWGFGLYALRSIYNPETESGDPRYKDFVIDLLGRVDLFFGLAQLQLNAITKVYGFITEAQLSDHDYEYERIKIASENLIEKLEELQIKTESKQLTDFIENLGSFFGVIESGSVRYIEFREGYVGFINQPINIDGAIGKVLEPYAKKALFIDSKSSDLVEKYFVKRLGIEEYSRVYHEQGTQSQIPIEISVSELQSHVLFSGLNVDRLPLVITFTTLTEIKEFYKQYHEELNQLGVVYAQGYSGGTNKIIRNFGLRARSILIVTHDFLSQAPLRALFPKHLVISNYGSGNTTHPYVEALEKHYGSDLGAPMSVIRSLLTFENLIKRVAHSGLEKVELYTNASDSTFLISYLETSAGYQISQKS